MFGKSNLKTGAHLPSIVRILVGLALGVVLAVGAGAQTHVCNLDPDIGCPDPTPTPILTPTPTPTPSPTPVTGWVNPKYLIVGVTYAPPGAQSSVTYANSVLVGTTTSIASSFSNQVQLSESGSKDISAWGAGGKITGTASTSYTQGGSTSSAVTLSKTTTVADKTSGPANSFAPGGVDHDYDVIWLWLNPVFPFTFADETNPNVLTWNGFGYDPNDQPGVDVFPVFVGWLNGDISLPPDAAQVLARTWANNSNYVFAPGQGPGLTGPGPGSDFATIATADPFWQCDQSPANCPATPDPARYTLSLNQNLVYEQAPIGGQSITQTYTLQYTNSTVNSQGTSSSFSQGFSLEEGFTVGIFGVNINSDFKQSNTTTWTNSTNTALTNTANNTAAASITGPPCTVPAGANFCSPEYDGPAEFDVYIDNQYGTFLFFPVTDPRFRMAVTPAIQNVAIGGSTTYAISTTQVQGFTGTINLTLDTLPSGATASFDHASIPAGGSATLTVTTSSTSPTASTTFHVIGTSGSIVIGVPVTLVAQDFSVTATPSSVSVLAGSTATYTVNTAGVGTLGFNDSITLSATGGLPGGSTVTFSPNPTPGVGSSTLSVTVPAGTAPGNYQFKVIGTDGSLSHTSASLTLTVLTPDFTISATPTAATVLPGGCATYTISTTTLNGFTGIISLSEGGEPSASTATFTPLTITGAGSSSLKVCTTTLSPVGSYTINITGISGSLAHSAPVALVVQDFSVAATPSTQTIAPGGSAAYTFTIAPLNGFNGNLTLSAGGLPPGATASIAPGLLTGSGSATITIATTTTVAPGTYVITFCASSGSVSHCGPVTLIIAVPDFSISATPSSQTIAPGGSTTYTISTSALNGFGSEVALSLDGLPSGASANFSSTSINGAGFSALTVSTSSSTPTGTYTLTIIGISSNLQHSANVILAVTAPPGLVSWWPADNSATDVVGGNNGTLSNGVTYAPGEVNQAFSFNGSQGNVQVGGSYSVAGARSISAWVFVNSFSGDGIPVLTAGSPGAGDFFGISGTTGNCSGSGPFHLYVDHWGTACFISNLSLTPNAWNHIALTFDGANIVFYINGVAAQPISASLYNYNISTFTIGGNTIGGSTTQGTFNGLIDEVRFYNGALSQKSVESL